MQVMRAVPAKDNREAQELFAHRLWELTIVARKEAADVGARFARDQAQDMGYKAPKPPYPGYAPDAVKTVIRENWRGEHPWDAVADRLEAHVMDASRAMVINSVNDINDGLDIDWSELDDLEDDSTTVDDAIAELAKDNHDVDPPTREAVDLSDLEDEWNRDPDGGGAMVGWARVLGPNDNHCAFCVMLASRGPVYKSPEDAGRISAASKYGLETDSFKWANRYHDHCECAVVMVQHGKKFDGSEQTKAARDLYRQARDRVNSTSPSFKDILHEIDKLLAEREDQGRPVDIPDYAA